MNKCENVKLRNVKMICAVSGRHRRSYRWGIDGAPHPVCPPRRATGCQNMLADTNAFLRNIIKDPHRYAVQVSDTTKMPKAS